MPGVNRYVRAEIALKVLGKFAGNNELIKTRSARTYLFTKNIRQSASPDTVSFSFTGIETFSVFMLKQLPNCQFFLAYLARIAFYSDLSILFQQIGRYRRRRREPMFNT